MIWSFCPPRILEWISFWNKLRRKLDCVSMLKNARLWGRKCRGGITPGLSTRILTSRSTNINYDSEHSCYLLGVDIGPKVKYASIEGKIQNKFHWISRAPLKPNQKMYTLGPHQIPILVYYLTFTSISLKSLNASDTKIRSAVRQWLRLPKICRLLSSTQVSRLENSDYCSSENGCRSLESIECQQWWHSPSPMRMSFCGMQICQVG